MENKEIKKKTKDNLLDIINKYYKMIITIGSAICVIVLCILKFLEYIAAVFYFSYYGLSIGLYKYNDQGFIYSLCLLIVFLISFGSIVLNARSITQNGIKIKKLLSIIVFNILLNLIYFKFVNMLTFVIYIFVLLIAELVLSHIIFKENVSDVADKKSLTEYFQSLAFLVVLGIILYGGNVLSRVFLVDTYSIIDDNKAIVYTNNEYYAVLDCEIVDNELILYKGKQTKINNNNVKSKLVKFKRVKIK